MNRKQIGWAKRHDWFVGLTDDGIGVRVKDYMPVPTGMSSNPAKHGLGLAEITVEFRDYEKLRGWAGY